MCEILGVLIFSLSDGKNALDQITFKSINGILAIFVDLGLICVYIFMIL